MEAALVRLASLLLAICLGGTLAGLAILWAGDTLSPAEASSRRDPPCVTLQVESGPVSTALLRIANASPNSVSPSPEFAEDGDALDRVVELVVNP
jgi:hypothetical protein